MKERAHITHSMHFLKLPEKFTATVFRERIHSKTSWFWHRQRKHEFLFFTFYFVFCLQDNENKISVGNLPSPRLYSEKRENSLLMKKWLSSTFYWGRPKIC